MDDRISQLVSAIAIQNDEFSTLITSDIAWLAKLTDDELVTLLRGLVEVLIQGGTPNEKLLSAVLRQIIQGAYGRDNRQSRQLSSQSRAAAVELYRQLGSASSSRHSLLQLLAVSRSRDDLKSFAELVATDPPADATAAAMSFGPLFQRKDYDATTLFPRLLDAIGQPGVAPLIMDLSNYVTREGLLPRHPAAERRVQLVMLLGSLVQRLGLIEERPDAVSQDERELSGIVSLGVSLAVSLCDALALIGDVAAIGKLNQVLELRHRRLRTEAAAALARLGDENGRQVLLSLAAEPVARLRVLAYADELGLEDRVDEQFATPAARAEAELALWLAEPTQMGFPPSELELVDSKTLYWPGYDEPVDCFLFRFAYEVGAGDYANIGIAGPMCHAFAADLADLPPDDIYAIFAGWQAEHDEIYEMDATQLSESQRVELARLERRLKDEGCSAIQPATLGSFFGEKVLIARAVRDGQAGIGVATLDEVQWQSVQGRRRPLGPQEAYCLFKGRRLLRAFNP